MHWFSLNFFYLSIRVSKCWALTICTEISVKNFRQMVLVFFLAPKTGTGLSCTIYKIPLNFSLSLDMKPSTSNPNKWYRKSPSSRLEREKGNTTTGITFFPENFHRDEPFHWNSPRNFRVFHTNGKRSLFKMNYVFTIKWIVIGSFNLSSLLHVERTFQCVDSASVATMVVKLVT